MSGESSHPRVKDAVPSADPSEFVGRVLSGRYEVISLAGEGAMGAVYRARHTFMNKDVAIKVLHKEMTSNSEIVERFQREAQAAAHIAHPNVCVATDFARYDENGFFLVMEWLEGESLEEVVARADVPEKRAIRIAVQIADALIRAHELEIVHRDLKPANIMLVEQDGIEDFVKVTDFGVARVRLGNAAVLTQAGMAYGTPSYMAPEQASGEDVDSRTDLYALGVILYEMLTGRTPFIGEGIAHVLSMHVTETPPPIAEVAPHAKVSTELESFIMKCLEKDPDHRPQSATDAAEELRTIAENQVGMVVEDLADTSEISDDDRPASLVARREEQKSAPTPFDGDEDSEGSEDSEDSEDSEGSENPGFARTIAMMTLDEERGGKKVIGILAAIVLVGALIAVGLGVFAGSILSNQVEELEQQTLSEERAEFSKQPEIAAALLAQAQGENTNALEALESAQLNYESNPHYHYLVGNLRLQDQDFGAAFESFTKAVNLDERYGREQGLRAAVVRSALGRKKETEAAIIFLKEHADGDYRRRLFEAATTEEKRRDRARVADVLQETGQMEALEEWQRVGVTLRTSRKCKELESALVKAMELGDDRLATMVEYVYQRPTRGCGFLNTSDCFSCLRDEAEEAAKQFGVE